MRRVAIRAVFAISAFVLASMEVKGCCKAELLQEGIFFPYPFICQRRFSNEKVGNRKNQAHFYQF